MRTKNTAALGVALIFLASAPAIGQSDANLAMNAPDELAWRQFIQVNTSAGGNSALFETWSSDAQTFQTKPVFLGTVTAPSLHLPALFTLLRAKAIKAGKPFPLAPSNGVLEEVRRNYPAYKFIVDNGLYKKSGLQQAFGKVLSFPPDAMEIKANWIAVSDVLSPQTTYKGAAADIPKSFHVNTGTDKDGNHVQYALLSMHIISKLVPNWTWATFESRYNPKRCDDIGCRDSFGATVPLVKPNPSPKGYGDCVKTPALKALIAQAKWDPAFANYCLKGSQVDFTDNTGMAIRLGNSITEKDKVATSSCMTCHSHAGWTSDGSDDGEDSNFVLGPPDPSVFWNLPTPPLSTAAYPFSGMQGVKQTGTSADFVWAIPFCAYDDSDPKNPVIFCGGTP